MHNFALQEANQCGLSSIMGWSSVLGLLLLACDSVRLLRAARSLQSLFDTLLKQSMVEKGFANTTIGCASPVALLLRSATSELRRQQEKPAL